MCKIIEEYVREVSEKVAKKSKQEIARSLLTAGIDIAVIAASTGLTIEEIQKIAEEKELVTV